MITTNLTLTNGATSEVPIQVTGITFEVDSKLAVNPSVVFPLTVAIDSSEIIGIDFDETLLMGDFIESLTINTLGGRHDIVHSITIDDLTSTGSFVGIGDGNYMSVATHNYADILQFFIDNPTFRMLSEAEVKLLTVQATPWLWTSDDISANEAIVYYQIDEAGIVDDKANKYFFIVREI